MPNEVYLVNVLSRNKCNVRLSATKRNHKFQPQQSASHPHGQPARLGSRQAQRVAVACWYAVRWASEALPIPVGSYAAASPLCTNQGRNKTKPRTDIIDIIRGADPEYAIKRVEPRLRRTTLHASTGKIFIHITVIVHGQHIRFMVMASI